MESNNKKDAPTTMNNKQTPDLSKAREEFNKEVENSGIGAEMLDYGPGGPGVSRDDSSIQSHGEHPDRNKGAEGSDTDIGSGVGSTD